MLDWFKRITVSRDQEAEAARREAKVERLVGRFSPHADAPSNSELHPVETEVPASELEAEAEVSAGEALAPREAAAAQSTVAWADKPAPAVSEDELTPSPAADDVTATVTADVADAAVVEETPVPVASIETRLSPASPGARVAPAFRDTRVIVVASQKGGSGKTTIAAHIAVKAGMAGQGPAVLVDTDPQGSLTEWWHARADDSMALERVKLSDLSDHLAELRRKGAALVIIDTPPALTTSIEQVIAVADLVLVPARPSPHDLRAVGATVAMIRKAGKPFLFVVNGAAPRANITAEAVAALSEHGQVAPVILYQRTDYAASMIDGRTVMEAAPNSRSTQEIGDLWNYVQPRINLRAAA